MTNKRAGKEYPVISRKKIIFMDEKRNLFFFFALFFAFSTLTTKKNCSTCEEIMEQYRVPVTDYASIIKIELLIRIHTKRAQPTKMY